MVTVLPLGAWQEGEVPVTSSPTRTCLSWTWNQDCAGSVLITMPGGMVDDPAVVTAPGVRPAFLSAASAAASGWPVTCGTPIMTGPEDAKMVTTAPREALAPIAGSVRTTSPFGIALLCWLGPIFTAKPRFCSSVRAVLTAIARTGGTVTYCPDVTHQVIRPMIRAAPRARAV